jgi:hypothetical protein
MRHAVFRGRSKTPQFMLVQIAYTLLVQQQNSAV